MCLACGARMEESLVPVGSLRCLDCRDTRRPLDPELLTSPRPGRVRAIVPSLKTWVARNGNSHAP